MAVHLELLLHAADPAAWLAAHHEPRAWRWLDDVDPAAVEVVTLADVLADDAAVLRRCHRRLVDDGTPAPAAATYLAEWFAGTVAGVVGVGFAAAGAGFLLGGPEVGTAVRYRLHPDGWVAHVDVPARAVVAADHPWAGTPGVRVVAGPEQVLACAVDALIATVGDVVEACHGLARVGRAGLWNEVGDGLGAAAAHHGSLPVDERVVEVLRHAVDRPGVPWRTRPDLLLVESERLGTVHLARKGGCCLAYTRPVEEIPEGDLDEDRRAYRSRFPEPPGAPRYCMSCSFRTIEDSTARQLWWRERDAGA